jgi:hypothetical protein
MGLAASTAGCRKESSVWNYYGYVSTTNKCHCKVPDKTGKLCGKEITGRHCTNLKVHLSSFHSDVYKERVSADNDEKAAVRKRNVTQRPVGDTAKQITMHAAHTAKCGKNLIKIIC